MARIRTVKPEFWKNEALSALPEATHLLAAALLNYADDEGYFNANPALVKAECSPLREPSVSVHESLKLLAEIGYLRLGKGADGRRYGHIVNFSEHQRVNRPTPSKISSLGVAWEGSVSIHGAISEPSPLEGKGKEQGTGKRNRGGGEAVASRLPSDWQPSEENLEYCRKTRPDLNPAVVVENFRDYWLAKPGQAAKKLDWDRTWNRWVREEKFHEANQRSLARPGRGETVDEKLRRLRGAGKPGVGEPDSGVRGQVLEGVWERAER